MVRLGEVKLVGGNEVLNELNIVKIGEEMN